MEEERERGTSQKNSPRFIRNLRFKPSLRTAGGHLGPTKFDRFVGPVGPTKLLAPEMKDWLMKF